MDKILEILQKMHPEHDFSASSDLVEEGLLDSFDVVILVDKIEEAYGISIDGAEVNPDNFKDLMSLRALVGRLSRGKDV